LKKVNEKRVVAVVITTGIASVVTQLVLIREFLTQFQGNEIVIALILFSWLVLGGLGTLLAGPAAGSRLVTRSTLAWLSLALVFSAPLTLIAARLLRGLVFTHGASVGFYPTFAYIAGVAAPYALLNGLLLPLSLFVLKAERPGYPGALVYIWDNIGDISGGALFCFLIVFWLTPVQALAVAHLPLLTAVLVMPSSGRRPAAARISFAAAALLVLATALAAEKSTLTPSQGDLVRYRESRYGRITVVAQQELVTLLQDGTPVLSSQDPAAAEEAVHYALAQLDAPKRILLISAAAGVMEELEKYPLEAIDYVELDPDLTEALFDFNLLRRLPSLRVIHADGRAFLTETLQTYDAILVNLNDPQTFQTNRFFTDRFFSLARARLSDQGVLSFATGGFDSYLAEPQRRKLSSIYHAAKDYFADILMLPGERVFFICGNRPLHARIHDRLERKGISTSYIGAFFEGNVTPERIESLRARMDPAEAPNVELAPYVMRAVFAEWFAKFHSSPLWFMAAVAAALAFYFWRTGRVEFILFSTGWMTMGSEILVIFAFQIFFGYIYFKIGIIVTVFLAGLLPGAIWGRRFGARSRRVLIWSDVALIALLGATLAAVHAGDRLGQAFYLYLGFSVSFACGLQFPAALQLRGGGDRAATWVFSADLIGAALGTIVTSTVLIPYLGITGAIGALTGLKVLSLLMAGTLHDDPDAKTVPG
jgi:spermidine synthase